MKAIIALFIPVVLLNGWLVVAQDLPPDILADQYLLEATEALERGDSQAAIQAFGKIETLNVEPPLEFLYFYGKLLVENGTAMEDVLKGQSLLKQYVLNIDKDTEHYTPTLKLLSLAGGKLEEIDAEQRRLEEVRRHLAELLAHVQGGTFTMGCMGGRDDSCRTDEDPAHRVRVRSFEIGKYEVTRELWELVTGDRSRFRDCARCPANKVSWDDVQAFLNKLNELTGARYRLPTEAEWEYAARGGKQSRGYKYAGSNNPDTVAWYEDNSDGKVYSGGQKQPNELGLYDMSGNVWEWVQDCWNPNYKGAPENGDAWETGDACRRVQRGGGSRSETGRLRAANRSYNPSGKGHFYRGFRLARTLTSGRKTLTYTNGDRYEGGVLDGKRHGQGIYTWADGARYEGEWRDHKRHGQGTFTRADGSRYEGEYRDGKRHGQGTFTWADGSRYEGEYRDGKRHGWGVLTGFRGDRYEGQWRDGKRHGRGTQVGYNGMLYEGQWRNNVPHGRGIGSDGDGNRYEGQWRDGCFGERGDVLGIDLTNC